MSLFQIAEPGQSKVKEACSTRAVGIDLGTTNSLVAVVDGGNARIIREGEVPPGAQSLIGGTPGGMIAEPGHGIRAPGDALLPSVVHYSEDGSVVVGARARELASRYPRDTIVSVKRFIGRGPDDAEAQRALTPYRFAESDGRMVRFSILGGTRSVTPVEVSAEILRALKHRAEAGLGTDVESAVITVPAYFDDAQRQATRDAGRLAGLDVLRLLAEPTAAALAYGLDQGKEGTFAVYDLGGGTFDISILELVDGVFRVRATGGDSALGGDDFDHLLAETMLARAGFDLTGQGDTAAERVPDDLMRQALVEAREAKERLTDGESAPYCLDLPSGQHYSHLVTRADMASIMRPLLDKTGRACRRALKDAELRARDLDGVLLVGGSTRSPMVRDFVAETFARDPLCDIDPEHVVALGAAAQAQLLSGGDLGAGDDVLLLDVIPLSLGIETMGGVVEKIIHRNSTIPTGAKQEFTTYADNQTGFDIHVVQGERETVDGNRSLARFVLGGIPPMVAGMARVEITFIVDADGILRVQAREKLTGIENSIEVKPSYGLTDEEVERMLMDSFEHAEDDFDQRNLRIERVEAERILQATRAAMDADPELLTEDTRHATEAAMAHLAELAQGSDHLAIRGAIQALDLASKPFAQERMNRAVAASAVGRKVDDVESELSRPPSSSST